QEHNALKQRVDMMDKIRGILRTAEARANSPSGLPLSFAIRILSHVHSLDPSLWAECEIYQACLVLVKAPLLEALAKCTLGVQVVDTDAIDVEAEAQRDEDREAVVDALNSLQRTERQWWMHCLVCRMATNLMSSALSAWVSGRRARRAEECAYSIANDFFSGRLQAWANTQRPMLSRSILAQVPAARYLQVGTPTILGPLSADTLHAVRVCEYQELLGAMRRWRLWVRGRKRQQFQSQRQSQRQRQTLSQRSLESSVSEHTFDREESDRERESDLGSYVQADSTISREREMERESGSESDLDTVLPCGSSTPSPVAVVYSDSSDAEGEGERDMWHVGRDDAGSYLEEVYSDSTSEVAISLTNPTSLS
ncbi:hypothetical protein KIPB_006076, partial [Kipferlia bialata]